MSKLDTRQVSPLEWLGVAAGVLAVVVSFMSWRHATGTFGEFLAATGSKAWFTAWGSGFSGWFPIILLITAAALILAPAAGVRVPAVAVLWLVIALAALVIIVVRWVSLPKPGDDLLRAHNVTGGWSASVGLYLGLLAAVISLVAAGLRLAHRSSAGDRVAPTAR